MPASPTRLPLTVVVPTLDEERAIGRCLDMIQDRVLLGGADRARHDHQVDVHRIESPQRSPEVDEVGRCRNSDDPRPCAPVGEETVHRVAKHPGGRGIPRTRAAGWGLDVPESRGELAPAADRYRSVRGRGPTSVLRYRVIRDDSDERRGGRLAAEGCNAWRCGTLADRCRRSAEGDQRDCQKAGSQARCQSVHAIRVRLDRSDLRAPDDRPPLARMVREAIRERSDGPPVRQPYRRCARRSRPESAGPCWTVRA